MGKQAAPYVTEWQTAAVHWVLIVGGSIALTTAVVGALLTR